MEISIFFLTPSLIQGEIPIFNLRPGASIPHFVCLSDGLSVGIQLKIKMVYISVISRHPF